MTMQRLRPTETAETVFDIDFDRLRSAGKVALLFDFDRTLASRGARVFPEASRSLLEDLERSGFRIGILTNRRSHRTIQDVPVPVLYHAGKPRRHGYLAMLDRLSEQPERAVMIGNRTMTDVLGGNRLGIHTILIRRPPETA
jgi:uncharacterized protein